MYIGTVWPTQWYMNRSLTNRQTDRQISEKWFLHLILFMQETWKCRGWLFGGGAREEVSLETKKKKKTTNDKQTFFYNLTNSHYINLTITQYSTFITSLLMSKVYLLVLHRTSFNTCGCSSIFLFSSLLQKCYYRLFMLLPGTCTFLHDIYSSSFCSLFPTF